MSVNIENKAARSGNGYESLRAISYVAIFGLIYGYLSLSTNPVLPKIAFLVLILLQFARIALYYKTFSRLGLGFEIAFLIALLAGILGSYAWNLRAHPIYSCVLLVSLTCSRLKSVLFGIDS